MNALSYLVAGLVLCQQAGSPVPDRPPPDPQSTDARARAMDQQVQEIKRLTAALQALGDPIQKRGDEEESEEFFKRSLRIIKGRALLLNKLRVECEQALEARYALENELEEYRRWIEEAERLQGIRKEEYEKRVEELRLRRVAVRNEGIVVAHLLHALLEARRQELLDQKKATDASEIAERAAELQKVLRGYDLVPNRDTLAKKYENLGIEELQAKLNELLGEIRDADFEASYIRQNLAVESPQMFKKFNRARREAIAKASSLIADSRYLEDQAAQVAIISKYLIRTLEELDRFMDIDQKALALEARLKNESVIADALKIVVGSLDVGKKRGASLDSLLPPDDLVSPTAKAPPPKRSDKAPPEEKKE
jgi:hypothetical protein